MANVERHFFDEEEPRIFTVNDENGEEIEFQLLDIATIDGVDYALLAKPETEEDEDEEDREVTIMRFIRNGNEVTLKSIEDDNEFKEVSKLLQEEYGEEDTEEEDN